MSKALEAKDLRLAEGAAAQESDIRELTAAQQAEGVRGMLQAVTSAEKGRGQLPEITESITPPSFDEAMAEILAIPEGDNSAVGVLGHKYINRNVRYVSMVADGPGLGFHFAAHDKSPLTPTQSEALAEALNKRIDVERMKKAAEKSAVKTAKRAEKKAQEEPKTEKEPDLADKVMSLVADAENMNHLTEVVMYCKRNELLEVDFEGRHWKVRGLEGNAKSNNLAQTINSKKNRLLNEIRITKERVEAFKKEIEYAPNLEELGKTAWNIHRTGFVEKKFVGKATANEWEALPKKGQQGSQELAKALSGRQMELRKLEDKQRAEKIEEQKAAKAKKDLARLEKRIRK